MEGSDTTQRPVWSKNNAYWTTRCDIGRGSFLVLNEEAACVFVFWASHLCIAECINEGGRSAHTT